MTDRITVRQQLLFLALFFLLTFFFVPSPIFAADHQGYLDWSVSFVTQGISGAFRIPSFNYGPTAVYFLYLFGKFFGNRLDDYHLLMRQAFFIFDLGAIFVLQRYLERTGRNAMLAFFVLFNLAFLYNALIWGQTDGVMTALLFFALVAGLVGQPELAAILFVVVFNLKPHPLVMLPVLGLVLLPTFVRQPLRILTTLLATAAVQFVLLLPFLENGEWRQWIAKYLGNASLFPFTSVNAFNMWHLILEPNPIAVPDSTTWAGLTFKTWGLMLFVCFGALALLPLAARAGVRALQRTRFSDKDGMLVFLVAGLISVGFFFFNTEMHERYAYPAVLFLGAYAVMASSYILYILVSVAHFLNIYAILLLSEIRMTLIERLATPEIVASMFLVALLIGLVQLYRMPSLRDDLRELAAAARHWRASSAPVAVNRPYENTP